MKKKTITCSKKLYQQLKEISEIIDHIHNKLELVEDEESFTKAMFTIGQVYQSVDDVQTELSTIIFEIEDEHGFQ